jgi:hypothetical protein
LATSPTRYAKRQRTIQASSPALYQSGESSKKKMTKLAAAKMPRAFSQTRASGMRAS